MAVNITDSHKYVVSTMGLALASLIEAIQTEISGAKFVYDEKLTFESTLEKFRSDNNMNEACTDLYPIFSFKRSVLKHTLSGASARVPMREVLKRLPDGVNTELFTAIWGEIEIDFVYYTKSVEDLERFEITYLSEEGISAIKEIKVDLVAETGGEWSYFLTHNIVLDDKSFQSDDFYYKAVSGKITMRGFYLLLRENAKHINEVKLKISNFNKEIYYQN